MRDPHPPPRAAASCTGSNMNYGGGPLALGGPLNAGGAGGPLKRKADAQGGDEFALPAPKRDNTLQASSAANAGGGYGGGGYGGGYGANGGGFGGGGAYADDARSPPAKAAPDGADAPPCNCGVPAAGMKSKVRRARGEGTAWLLCACGTMHGLVHVAGVLWARIGLRMRAYNALATRWHATGHTRGRSARVARTLPARRARPER